MRNFPYCGPLSFCRPKVGKGSKDIHPLYCFNGRKTILTHKARTGIYAISSLISADEPSEILIPAYNCGSEIDPILTGGSIPVMYRVDHNGWIDSEDIKNKITVRTRAVYVIHYFGFPQELSKVREICLKKGLLLIEDCALSLFSSMSKIGTVGDLAVFSLPKTLPIPDGGVLLINNPKLNLLSDLDAAPLIPVMKRFISIFKTTILHNWNLLWTMGNVLRSRVNLVESSKDNATKSSDLPDIPQDYYFRPHQINRSMSALSQQLLNWHDTSHIIAKRRFNYQYLVDGLKWINGIQLLFPNLDEGIVPLALPICTIQKTRMVAFLQSRGIGAIPWWAGYHRSMSWSDFPESKILKNTTVALPIHQYLEQRHLDHIIATLTEFIQNSQLSSGSNL